MSPGPSEIESAQISSTLEHKEKVERMNLRNYLVIHILLINVIYTTKIAN